MSCLVPVLFPGPWWRPLSYLSPEPLEEGVRVRAPLGHGKAERPKVGFVCSPEEGASIPPGRCKPLLEVVDPRPTIPPDLWHLVAWGGRQFGVPGGNLLELLFPRWVLEGEALCPWGAETLEPPGSLEPRCVLRCPDRSRWEEYRRILEEEVSPTLLLFPERIQGECFAASLEGEERQFRWVLWPSRARDQRLLWQEAREGRWDLVIGSQGAATLPLRGLRRVILDDESSEAWRPLRHPRISLRSLVGERCRVRRGAFFLGARVPSSKVFLRASKDPEGRTTPGKRLVFVDLHSLKTVPEEAGVPRSPVSPTLRRRTEEVLRQGGNALWVLDRKGFAGALLCGECGHSWACSACGAPVVWYRREDRLRCPSCGSLQDVPERCPRCGGGWIEARRPGLESLFDEARRFFGARGGGSVEDASLPLHAKERAARRGRLARGGVLLLGTRGALEICDQAPVGLIGWVEADGESLREEHDARFRAYRLLWESCWRGIDADSRIVVVQSRMAGKGWQGGLSRGWSSFWRQELEERRQLRLPPYGVLVQVEAPPEERKRIQAALDEAGASWMEQEGSDVLWIREEQPARVPVLLGRFLPPKRPAQLHPRITLWTD